MRRHYTTRRVPVEPVQARRKKLQLCRQVHETLMWVLGSGQGESHLSDCRVDTVEPLPGGNRLLVTIGMPTDLDLDLVREELERSARTLRTEVAQAVTRRKAPELIFRVVPDSR